MRYWYLLLTLVGCDPAAGSPLPLLPPALTSPVRVFSLTPTHFRCSGIQVNPNIVLTAAHCVQEPMWVDQLPVRAAIIPSLEWDMAILYVPGLEGRDVTWVQRKPEMGDTVNILGWGCSQFHDRARLEAGKVEAVDGRDVTLTVPVCHGDSGGPAFDDQGRLIGLIHRMVSESNPNAVIEYLAE